MNLIKCIVKTSFFGPRNIHIITFFNLKQVYLKKKIIYGINSILEPHKCALVVLASKLQSLMLTF